MTTPDSDDIDRLQPGTPAYRDTNFALFIGGFATFAMLYATQPILPRLAEAFGRSATAVSLSVTAGTALLALGLIPASILADRIGRVALMRGSLLLAATLTLAGCFVTDFAVLLVLRALLGLALAGLPAAAMAYLGEEVGPSAQGRVMGLYIAGNALGGMSGRVIAGGLADFASWRIALGAVGLLGLLAAVLFWRRLPASRHFVRRPASLARLTSDLRAIATDPALPWLFLTAGLLLGAFVGVYNYLGFRLGRAPFELGQTAISALFLLYSVGIWSSAWTGRLSDRFGLRNVLWLMVLVSTLGLFATAAGTLLPVIAGLAVFTFGFFGAHTCASGWVGRRAGNRRALTAALYLCSYYLGGSVLGTASGLAWDHIGWPGVIGLFITTQIILLAVALHLRHIPAWTDDARSSRSIAPEMRNPA